MKNRIFHLTFLFPGFLLLALLAACTSETEEYIQGYWYRGNAHFMDQWYFDAGTFQHKSTCQISKMFSSHSSAEESKT